MPEDRYRETMIMTKYAGKTFCRSLWGLVGCVLVVSWWSPNYVSVVVDALVTLRWCVCNVLTVFGYVLGVLLMSWWCFCGVLAVFRLCPGGLEGMACI